MKAKPIIVPLAVVQVIADDMNGKFGHYYFVIECDRDGYYQVVRQNPYGKFVLTPSLIQKENCEIILCPKDMLETKPTCDHSWKEWEDYNCNAQLRCTKCKEVK